MTEKYLVLCRFPGADAHVTAMAYSDEFGFNEEELLGRVLYEGTVIVLVVT